jgi:hypothetical protein
MAYDPARALRRRRKHERQAVVFGSLIAFLAVAGLGATAVYTGAVDVPFLDREFTTPEPEETGPVFAAPPCLPADTLPVAPAETQIRVQNGTSRPGLAGSTDTELRARGFGTIEVGNYRPVGVQGTARIRFGEAGIAAAYTLAAHVPDAIFVLDRRTDATIDLILGADWNSLIPLDEVVLDPAAPLPNPPGCIDLAQALASAQPAPSPSPTPEQPAGEEPVDPGVDEGTEGEAAEG